jgi:hypothetical protein
MRNIIMFNPMDSMIYDFLFNSHVARHLKKSQSARKRIDFRKNQPRKQYLWEEMVDFCRALFP